ncbi:alpha-galactosidase [Actinoallomurus sp. NBC_01490]|uniref:alpha-galactosidase n=1 Tax=Actinoallomurus sp. NBC_01490 TaxID=2903557 RepID=UPI002E30A175|nr:alpha-galactosidase [Actinoallomurus sp. NBC_01490]
MSLFDDSTTIMWGHSALRLTVDVTAGRPVSIRELTDGPAADVPVRPAQPLVEILTPGTGRAAVSQRFAETTIGRRLVFAGEESSRDGLWHRLRITLRDEPTGLRVEVILRSPEGVSAVRSQVRVTNDGTGGVLLLGVSSFAAGFFGRPVERLDVVHGSGEWLGEGRWRRRPFREIAPDLGLPLHGQHGRGRFAAVSTGAWSTSGNLPTGGLIDRESGDAWLWQVEHNGAWRWETGERLDGVYVTLLGPTDLDHQWRQELRPGASFTTVPVSVAVSGDDLHGAAAALTAHRRAIVRPHADRAALPVVFNDYMNTLMGDPTTAKLLPLIDAAADAGAEVFCVDAGWYGDDAWWDTVGAWEPSQTRFPRGIEEVLGHIRRRGMLPGLWLEPEVVGVRSPVAGKLPDEAFLQRGGVRVVEHGRYHLDLRHPLAVAHLDETIDRLVEELGVGYFKLDYNIDPGVGTDRDADSAGAGLLAHNRAHLAWLDQVLDRHPGLILENCASGAMRMDYAVLARMQLQSTSDQQDFRRYPPIAAAAPLSLLPEQSGIWAYPQPDMSDEEIAFTLCTALLGRPYLSGHLDRMAGRQLAAVRDAVNVHRDMRAGLVSATPLWPLGLPGWSDPWLSLALRVGDTTYVTVWHRGGTTGDAVLSLPHLTGAEVEIDTLYPRHLPPFGHRFDPDAGRLTVLRPDPETVAARLFRVRSIRKDSL